LSQLCPHGGIFEILGIFKGRIFAITMYSVECFQSKEHFFKQVAFLLVLLGGFIKKIVRQ
jgi:hypothetical protein